ncbi:MAG: magnesium transporter [Dehalococcoidia bacterium]|jgi:magnesium transporter|nr:magnesium transporter [Dehalococcoidia bacterium]
MSEERTSSIPAPETLEELQAVIEAHLDAGAPAIAAAELEDLRAPDQADVVAELSEPGQQALLGALPAESIAEIIEHLEVDDAAEISGLIDVGRMAAVLDTTPPEVAADILRHVDWTVASQVLARMGDRRTIGELLLYPDDDAGGLMTPEVTGLRESLTVGMALSVLRGAEASRENMRQLYAIDNDGRLTGVLELSDLVFAGPEKRVRDVMTPDPISVETGADQEVCAQLMTRYDLLALPVVDRAGVLVGAISVEELVEVARDEATEDMLRMFGIGGEERTGEPITASIRSRLPWLVLNLGTVLLAGFVLSLFDDTIESATIVAVFIPVVLGQAGIAGTQTLTLIVRSIALGDVDQRDTASLLRHELALSVVQGLVVAGILGLIVLAWQQDASLGLVIAGAMVINLIVAAGGGVLVPLGMRALRIDPAASSAVVVTTLTDVLGLLVYLGLATVFLTSIN